MSVDSEYVWAIRDGDDAVHYRQGIRAMLRTKWM
jgi:hypothetical protein